MYEHVKTKAQLKSDGTDDVAKSTKNHAGGNNERQDAYLYGHPLGRKKRYRSPADFFPHLLWLATDPEGDPDNCACKICAPDELQPEDDRVKAEPVKKEEDVKPTFKTQVIVEVPRYSPATTMHGLQANTQTATAQLNTRVLTPQQSALPQVRTVDQQVDTQYNRFVYRPGEVVWYCKGEAWGLAVVARRFNSRTSPNEPEMKRYLVQPLSTPLQPEQQVPLEREDYMRPWLAWSPPGFTMEGLGRIPNVSFDSVDWLGALNGKYGGSGDPQVDASILAARAVDASYSLFGTVRAGDGEQSNHERRWNGIFIGAEKFWVGDPARLKPGSGRDVFVITDIVERAQNPSAMQPNLVVQLVGDVYQPIEVPAGAATPSEPGLPPRIREDTARRNAITVPTKRTQLYWKLMSQQARISLDAVKGRWYEATLLIPILDGEPEYASRVAKGEIHEVGSMMNSRGDAQHDSMRKVMPIKKQSRHEAIGAAVPRGTAIMDGIDPPPKDEVDRMFPQINTQVQQGQQAEVPFDDIMDFGEPAGEQGNPPGIY